LQSPQPIKPAKRPRKNKTFLTVDSILKQKQKGQEEYVRASRQVLEVMTQVQNEHIQKEIRDMHVNPGRSVSPILSEQALRSKVDSMLHVSKDF
jgi:Ethanolamine utilization protein EutJ (predicted chaperonin)